MTAQDLLLEYLDYSCFWSSAGVKNERPAIVRIQRLEALLAAFGLTKTYINPLQKIMYGIVGSKEQVSRVKHLEKLTNIDYFRNGEFLHDRAYEANQELIGKVLQTVKERVPSLPSEYYERQVHIGWLFNDLLHFREEVYKVAYPWGGMLEGFSTGLYYSNVLSGKLKKMINENLEEIDSTLCLVIDPHKINFTKEELIQTYAYPDVNLDDIDREYTIENY